VRIGEATNEKDLLAALETTRKRREELRRGIEAVWWNNIALVTGDHHAQWDPIRATFVDRDPNWDWTDKKPRMVINHALTVARTELSKLTKSRPIMEVIANSDTQDDIAATRVGKSVLDFAEWRFRLRKMRRNALWWMIQTGLGAIYVGWDPFNDVAGTIDYIIDPESNEPVFNVTRERELKELEQSGEIPDLRRESVALGDLDYRLYTPFQLLPDETTLEFEEIKDLITVDAMDIDVVKGIYGSSADHLRPEDVTLGVMERRMLGRLGIQVGQTPTKSENAVKVYTFWLLPQVYRGNGFLRDGYYCRWCQGKIIDKMVPFPYRDNRMPFAFFEHIQTSMSIWPDSIMNHIRGPNLEIDKTVSQLIENKDYMSNPMWLIATQHKIRGEIKNEAGAIVRYVHVPNVPPPQPVEGLQMPPQVENLLAGLRDQILDISGQSEVARGRVPTGVRSGVAVAYLQEEDDTKIAPTVENVEEAIAMMSSLTLTRAGQYYEVSRLLRYHRQDGGFEAFRFKGTDLRDNTDVVAQAGSAMPKSKSARQQYTLELVSMGILRDPKQIKDMLELGSAEPSDEDKAIAQANRENNIMRFGIQRKKLEPLTSEILNDEAKLQQYVATAVPVKKWHNHAVHVARHTSAMMDPEFDELQETHPEVVRLFDEHLAMHQQILQEEQQAQMAMVQAMKGAPDGPPTPPGGAGPGNGFASQTNVPDVIGGGITQTKSRSSAPPPS
jgi:hypothetical protein